MLVQCPTCHTTYRVSDNLITAPSPTFRCSRCKHIFVLGLKAEASPAAQTTPPPPAPQRQDERAELAFSFPAPEKTERKETAEIKSAEVSAPAVEPEQPPAEEKPEHDQTELEKSASDPSFSIPEETPGPAPAESQPRTEPEPPPRPTEEKEEGWTLAPTRSQDREHFTIPEENRSLRMDGPTKSAPEFEEEWPESLPLIGERESSPDSDPYRDRLLSIVPYVSLFGALLLIFSLLALMYQAQPQTIESVIRSVPWLGAALLKNNHLMHGVALQSLRPGFQAIQGNREVFVLSGVAINRNPVSVREVRIEGHIFNAEGKEIDRQIVAVGNAISSKILRDLTAQEISILQKLNPQKRFEIAPDESAGFVIVFLKPSAEVKNFSCRILSVDAGA